MQIQKSSSSAEFEQSEHAMTRFEGVPQRAAKILYGAPRRSRLENMIDGRWCAAAADHAIK